MKLADAKPGDILQDRDGDVWVRTSHGAAVLFKSQGSDEHEASKWDLSPDPYESPERFGPFTRLVPEKEAP